MKLSIFLTAWASVFALISNEQQCDLMFSESVCTDGKKSSIMKQSVPVGLRGLWDFEEKNLLNHGSGNMIESNESLYSKVARGPSYLGDHKSAYFDGNQFISIQHDSSEFNTPIYTYSFWIFLIRQVAGSSKPLTQCPILQKGDDEIARGFYERSPAIYLNQKSRVIDIYIDQTVEHQEQQITLSSASRIQYNKWTHIAVISTSSKVKVYVNGILDNIQVLNSLIKYNQSPLYIGGVPWLRDECSLKMFLDKVSYFNFEQKAFYLQAQAQPALGLIEPASVHMGFISCSIEQAGMACIKGYHLCTSLEMYSGVYNLIVSLGWIEWDSNLWTYNMLYRQEEGSGINKLDSGTAICCID